MSVEARHAIALERVTVRLGGVEILQDVTCNVEEGEITALIGPNGAGKTTMLLAILGLAPFSGTIRFFPGESGTGKPRFGYVPQNLNIDRQSNISVLEFAALDLQRRPIWMGVKSVVRQTVTESLDRLNVAHLIDRPLGRLSGGELQRVLLALALHRKPRILFLDEPVSGVDVGGGHLFCDILDSLSKELRLTVLMVSHDLSVVSQHATRVICLNRTVGCQGNTPEVLSSEQLFAIYGIHSGLYEHKPRKGAECSHHDHSHGGGEF